METKLTRRPLSILYAEPLALLLYKAFEKQFDFNKIQIQEDTLFNIEEPVYISGQKHTVAGIVHVNASLNNNKYKCLKVSIVHFDLYTHEGVTATNILVARYRAEKRLFELIKYKLEN